MTGEGLFVCGLLGVTIIVFMSDRIRLDVVSLLVILALTVSGVLTPKEALAGFGDSVVVLIAGLFVVGEALSRTGVAAAIGARLLKKSGGSLMALQVRLMLAVALLSAFMSSTGAVAVFIPVAVGLARAVGVPPGRLLMPMAFAALLGGTLTLIGTPPNIVASGALEEAGYEPFAFYDFTPVGLALLAGGILYLVTLGTRLLPRSENGDSEAGRAATIDDLLTEYGIKGRFMLLQVTSTSPLAGQSLREFGFQTRTGLVVIAIQRGGRFGRDEVIVADGDTVPRVGEMLLARVPPGQDPAVAPDGLGLILLGKERLSRSLEQEIGVVEVVVAPRSTLRGKTIRELAFRRHHQLHVLGVQHKGEVVEGDPTDHELAMGDTLLLGGPWDAIEALRRLSGDLLVLSLPREWQDVAPAFRRAPVAVMIMIAMMVVMVLDILPAVVAVLAAGVALVATGCLSMPNAYRAVSWQSLVLIAGMLPMGVALDKTGALAYVVDQMVGALGGTGPLGLMAVLFLLTAILSQVISNTATTVLLAPVAIGIAEGLGVSPRPLVMAVALAASAAFITPVASPVNTLVLGPGGYKFGDFVRVGLPLLLMTMVIVLLVVPLLFPY